MAVSPLPWSSPLWLFLPGRGAVCVYVEGCAPGSQVCFCVSGPQSFPLSNVSWMIMDSDVRLGHLPSGLGFVFCGVG